MRYLLTLQPALPLELLLPRQEILLQAFQVAVRLVARAIFLKL
jgi:hypothetical protein